MMMMSTQQAVEEMAVVEDAGGHSFTGEQQATLAACERLLQEPKLARGLALRIIRDQRLYRATDATFEVYCQTRWHWSKTHVNRLIRGFEVLLDLAPIGVADLRESQARPLVDLSPEERRVVWQVVQGTSLDGQVTARHVRAVVTVLGDIVRLDAVDDGDGGMVPWTGLSPERKAALLLRATTEETYEAFQRQRVHLLREGGSPLTELFTPQRYVDAARDVLGAIDVDPASCVPANHIVHAARSYTAADDGLHQDWPGRVWLHPPSQLAGRFIEHVVAQYASRITTAAIVVLHAQSIAKPWFAPLWDGTLCFATERVPFQRPDGSIEPHPTLFVYFGGDPARFARVFSALGPVVRRWGSDPMIINQRDTRVSIDAGLIP